MGCQDLLEAVPGRGRVTNVSPVPGSLSEGKSLKVRAGLSGRNANGKTNKADELSCKCLTGEIICLFVNMFVLKCQGRTLWNFYT